MPVLANQRWERFARGLAEGKATDEAYEAAGYTFNRGNASRLKANEDVQKRVAEIQAAVTEKTGYTLERIAQMLDEDRELARSLGQTGPAVAASTALGKLHGHFIDRKEVGLPGEFEGLNAEQRNSLKRLVNRELEGRTEGVGKGRAAEPAPEIPTLQ